MSTPSCHLALAVPRSLIKRVKDALDCHHRRNRDIKIAPLREHSNLQHIDGRLFQVSDNGYLVPLDRNSIIADQTYIEPLSDLLSAIGLREHEEQIGLVSIQQGLNPQKRLNETPTNPITKIVEQWLHEQCLLNSRTVLERLPLRKWSYTVYPPMLLLPSYFHADLISLMSENECRYQPDSLLEMMCKKFGVSHIALNAPIPGSVSGAKDSSSTESTYPHEDTECIDFSLVSNVLRSPAGLTLLYGDFGIKLPSEHAPTKEDFSSAFWCTARQNGINQTWAPLYTMFSRGNISEKARILTQSSLAISSLGMNIQETSAVDLYAGIGYFAFSYAKAGVGRVFCWEINPWSVEGLRKGAQANGWDVSICMDDSNYCNNASSHSPIIVFQESNQRAASRIDVMRDTIPPIKNVNCGFLPSSKDSWEVAVQVLDRQGGWIHAHENIAKHEIELRAQEIVQTFATLAEREPSAGQGQQWSVTCEHVEEVKSYAPGVFHCVLDIAVMPTSSAK